VFYLECNGGESSTLSELWVPCQSVRPTDMTREEKITPAERTILGRAILYWRQADRVGGYPPASEVESFLLGLGHSAKALWVERGRSDLRPRPGRAKTRLP